MKTTSSTKAAKGRGAGTRDKVLACAVEEFLEYGFYGARTQRIADRAGVNKAMLHYYYSTKEQMYKEALGTIFQTVMQRLDSLSDEPVPVQEKIGQIVDAYIDVFSRYPAYLRLLLYELSTGGESLKKFQVLKPELIPFTPGSGRIYRYFEEKIRSGEIQDVNILHLVLSIVGQVMATFIARPIVERLTDLNEARMKRFLGERKKFIVRLTTEGVLVRGGNTR
jgi:AcrR family transcriptional regulator